MPTRLHAIAGTVVLAACIAFAGCAAPQEPEPALKHEPEQAIETAEAVEEPETEVVIEAEPEIEETTMITVTVGDETLTLVPADTEAARELVGHLQEGPVTLELSEYGGFEKVGPLPWSLTQTDGQITTQPGDVVLYQGDQVSMFYSSNSWSYTRLGRFADVTEDDLRAVFGSGNITVTLSL